MAVVLRRAAPPPDVSYPRKINTQGTAATVAFLNRNERLLLQACSPSPFATPDANTPMVKTRECVQCTATRLAHTFSPTEKNTICHVNFSGDVLVPAGNALLRVAGCWWRRDKTELSHHADVIAGRVVIGDFAVSELQPVNMIGLEVFSGRSNAY